MNGKLINGTDEAHHKFIAQPKTVSILGVAFSGGQAKGGVENGPQTLAEFGLHQQLRDLDWNVTVDARCQDLTHLQPLSDPDIGKLKKPRYVSAVCEYLANVVEEHAKRGELVLTIGGDHSLAMGTLGGTTRAHPDLCVIWVDAHADINTPLTTDSGNLHGCPLAFLLGLEGTDLPEFSWLSPCLTPDRLVYIGLRDVDQGEKRILKQLGIKAFSMTEVDRYGIGQVVEMALDHVNPNRDRPIHLSYDVDGLDPSVAPATGTPVRGGLTFREGHYICERLHETGLLCAMDVMEVNPALAHGDIHQLTQTVAVGCSLVRSALGETLL
ncbi:arginase [Allomyces macrogynus ATCC 38327]|uniref:Arginase n=1 Tax=Allomyces macrogynus (strain ATCC 38327) TaxID=578462 RepID=A0A0L0SNH5_ALLM3|nr:arginase [Allomyces macrogynus ATCC 38327]|eukprot:KNE64043.1 arginase [Allomyces macrogynus ATCC 38327]